jgi:phosphoglycolate phosphatase-like HAD superfamily hydrolase
MARYSTIIFAFDGVILESVDIKAKAFADIYKGEAPEKIDAVVQYQLLHGGVSRRDKFNYFEAELFDRTADSAVIDTLCRRYSELVLDQVMACPFVPGALEFLEEAHHKLPLHVVSGTPQSELDLIVGNRGLRRYFHEIVGAPTRKLQAFDAIAREGGHAPDDVLTVGDSITEYMAALELGMPFLGIVAEPEPNPFPASVRIHNDLVRLSAFIEEGR